MAYAVTVVCIECSNSTSNHLIILHLQPGHRISRAQLCYTLFKKRLVSIYRHHKDINGTENMRRVNFVVDVIRSDILDPVL